MKQNPEPEIKVLQAAKALFVSLANIALLYFIQLVGRIVQSNLPPTVPAPTSPEWFNFAANLIGVLMGLNIVGVTLWAAFVFIDRLLNSLGD